MLQQDEAPVYHQSRQRSRQQAASIVLTPHRSLINKRLLPSSITVDGTLQPSKIIQQLTQSSPSTETYTFHGNTSRWQTLSSSAQRLTKIIDSKSVLSRRLVKTRTTSLAQLQRVQNAAVRLVGNLRPRDKVDASLRELHWLPIRYRIIYQLCLMMHDAHVGHSPRYVNERLTATAQMTNRNRLRSSASTRYELPALPRKIGERAFSYSGPTSWNSLPSDITSIMDTPTF